MAIKGLLAPPHEVRLSFLLRTYSIVLRCLAVLIRTFRRPWEAFAIAVVTPAFASSPSAMVSDFPNQRFQPPIKATALVMADRMLLLGGCVLLVVGGVFAMVFWKSKRRRRPRSATKRSIAVGQSPSHPPVLDGMDLRLLWFMSDEKAEALPAEIERYIAAFETDLHSTHSAVSSHSAREIHRSAHRLIAHSAAINYEPLLHLATKLQSEASNLNADELDQLMSALDLRFAELKETLSAVRVSTEHG